MQQAVESNRLARRGAFLLILSSEVRDRKRFSNHFRQLLIDRFLSYANKLLFRRRSEFSVELAPITGLIEFYRLQKVYRIRIGYLFAVFGNWSKKSITDHPYVPTSIPNR